MTIKPNGNPCVVLAQVGFAALLEEPTIPDHDTEAAWAWAAIEDHRKVARLLCSDKPEPHQYGQRVKWLGRSITWPDRFPDLKTWGGQQTLAKLIVQRQRAMQPAVKEGIADLYEYRAEMSGASGIDPSVALGALERGYSADDLGLLIPQRPALELLAIIGVDTLPLVSFARHDCGFLLDNHLWRFTVDPRGDNYYYRRWGWIQRQPERAPTLNPDLYAV